MRSYQRPQKSPQTCGSGGGIGAPNGFTLLELLVTLAIVAILASIAGPSYREVIEGSNRRGALADVSDALALARAEAVSRGAPVRLCSIANPASVSGCNGGTGWESGIGLFTSDATPVLIRLWENQPTGITIRALNASSTALSTITFVAAGDVASAVGFVICSESGAAGKTTAQGLVLSAAGLARVAIDTNSNSTIELFNNTDVGNCPT